MCILLLLSVRRVISQALLTRLARPQSCCLRASFIMVNFLAGAILSFKVIQALISYTSFIALWTRESCTPARAGGGGGGGRVIITFACLPGLLTIFSSSSSSFTLLPCMVSTRRRDPKRRRLWLGQVREPELQLVQFNRRVQRESGMRMCVHACPGTAAERQGKRGGTSCVGPSRGNYLLRHDFSSSLADAHCYVPHTHQFRKHPGPPEKPELLGVHPLRACDTLFPSHTRLAHFARASASATAILVF